MKPFARALGIGVLAVVAVATPARAYFEEMVTGTRGVALGLSALAAIDDVSALYWNPATLAKLRRHEFLGDFSRPYGLPNLGENALIWGRPIRETGVALGWHRLGIAGIYAEDVFALAAGRQVYSPGNGHAVMAGMTLKMMRVSFAAFPDPVSGAPVDFGAQSRGSIDLGLTWSTPWKADLAWVARDVSSPNFQFVEGTGGGTVERRQELAVAYRWNPESIFTAGWSQVDGSHSSTINAGLEIWFFDVFAIRSGFTNLSELISATGSPNEFQYTGGFGIRHKGYRVDFAAFTHHDLGASYRAGVLFPLPSGAPK